MDTNRYEWGKCTARAWLLILLVSVSVTRAADYAPDHVIVKFKTGEVARVGRDVNRFGLPRGARISASKFDEWVKRREGRTHPGPTYERFTLCSVPAGMTATALVEALQGNPFVEYAEVDHIGTGGFTPNDTSFVSQWHLRNNGTTNAIRPDIRATNTWDITQGSTGVILAVLDTGINTARVDFVGRLVPGYDFVNNDNNPADDHGHGSAAAGTAAASGNNSSGTAGVDWNCRIMPVKVLNSVNSGNYSDFANGIDWARTNGAKVINFSIGGFGSDTTLSNSIMSAINSGMIFITITHNDGSSTVRFPGTMDLCITVGATQSNDTHAPFSNYGSTIDLSAPGTGIVTIGNSAGVEQWWGTSFAAPQVAGVCSLLAGMITNLTQSQARTLLCAGADDQVGNPVEDTAGFDNYHGWGRLNAWATLQLARTTSTVVRLNNGGIEIVWPSPSNASNKQPHRVEYASSLTGAWTSIAAPTNVVFSATNTTWTDNGTETGGAAVERFYRLKVDEN
jgi:thermitase